MKDICNGIAEYLKHFDQIYTKLLLDICDLIARHLQQFRGTFATLTGTVVALLRRWETLLDGIGE